MSSSSSFQSCKGWVYAITSCGGGIGGATAERLAELGAAGVAIADISEKALQSRKASINGKYPECKVVATNVDAWPTAIIAKSLGGSTAMATSPGPEGAAARVRDHRHPDPARLSGGDAQSDDHWHHAVNINPPGNMNCMRAQLRVITKSGAGLGGLAGHILYEIRRLSHTVLGWMGRLDEIAKVTALFLSPNGRLQFGFKNVMPTLRQKQ
ncbi:hypothetical protein Daus18300_000015 [Diaporthe australafricana]|uniref:Uncharacterized protein n=1 Tax=Diaporthe australafricana TaxID=127596 RepID=A0ABR3Y6J5_9PEZI